MRRTATQILLFALGVGPLPAPAAAPEPTASPGAGEAGRLALPWREAGWTEREAAAHLVDRLTFGARPGEVDRVLALGLEAWVERQLAADLPEPELARDLARLPALAMSSEEIARTYPPGFAVRRMAEEAGVVSRAELEPAPGGPEPEDQRALRRKVYTWMREQGYRPERELVAQSHAQKLLRAVAAENQLAEVLADFWFNHFNVSLTDNQVRQHLLGYERDAIRPHLFGSFRALLEATAKHPAMLVYLDNARSVANPGQPTTLERELERADERRVASGGMGGARRPGGGGMMGGPGGPGSARTGRRPAAAAARPNRPQGLNENYARELLELHTLGVDGGYTQQDVIEVARAFTGWTLLPPVGAGEEEQRGLERARRGLERAQRAGGLGFQRDGDFVFRADAHDAAEKTVLGVKLPAGRGLADGEQVLDLLAAHPATARHIAHKLAVRFVADEPAAALVERLAATFTATRGDLRAVVRTLVGAPEFWARAARGAKIKSPFEVAVSALRALDARVANPLPTLEWIARMGQPLYAYQAPTGYPDRADFWVNTGALLARMNFGLELAAGKIGGVGFDLAALDEQREPESAAAALSRYAELLLPERAVEATVAQLAPLLSDPEVARKVADRVPVGEAAPLDEELFVEAPGRRGDEGGGSAAGRSGARRGRLEFRGLDELFPAPIAMARPDESPTVVAGAVGLLLGSPEFQRR